jgi:hypothetical protein
MLKSFLQFINESRSDPGLIQLSKYLVQHGIQVDRWGQGSAKTVEHLEEEILSGESRLVSEKGTLYREIEFVMSDVLYSSGDAVWRLVESKQVFQDGRVRVRQKDSSVSEKMKPGEDPVLGLIRGIEEELGFRPDPEQIERLGILEEEQESKSFPGLRTRYRGHRFQCYLTDLQWNPAGYQERQPDKTTWFSWVRVEE